MWPANGCYSGQIELQCDNLTGVNDSSEKNMKTRKTKKFRGLLRAIRKTLHKLRLRGLSVNMKHVKGHQDKYTYFEELPRWAQLNILADQEAKKRLLEFLMNGGDVKSSSYHGEGWTFWLGNKKCEDFTRNSLHKWIYQEQARQCW